MFNMTEQMKKIQKMNEEKRLENLKEKNENLRKEYIRKIQEYDDLVKIYNDITSDFYKDPIIEVEVYILAKNITDIRRQSIEIMKKIDE